MYRIVIADDEPLIIRGLKKMMDWEKLDAEVVGTADDGEQLLKLLESLAPDIVISDIAMPGKSGLDVIREVKDRSLDTKVIFMSGYQEFDYAKAAVTYGAVDYLLKPVTVEELEKAIENAKEELLRSRPDGAWRQLERQTEEDFRNLHSQSGRRTAKKVELPQNFRSARYLGVCFSLHGDTIRQIADSNRSELMRFAIFKQIEGCLQETGAGFVARREDNSSTVILAFPREKEADGRQTIEEIRGQIAEKYGVTLVVGIGACTEEEGKLDFVARTASFSAGMYYFTRQETVDYREIERSFTCSFDQFEELCREMTQKILMHDEGWKQSLAECLKVIRNLHYGSSYALESRCIILAMNLYRSLLEYHVIDGADRERFEREAESLRGQDTYEDMRRRFTKFIERFVNDAVFCREQKENDAIFKVKAYIEENFAQDVTLEQMASLVYMNPYYFSTFFKKETGENFKSYLLSVRMKKALQYLMETDQKTYELARSVGYHDVRTFVEKFREFYGSSPAKYKKHKKEPGR